MTATEQKWWAVLGNITPAEMSKVGEVAQSNVVGGTLAWPTHDAVAELANLVAGEPAGTLDTQGNWYRAVDLLKYYYEVHALKVPFVAV